MGVVATVRNFGWIVGLKLIVHLPGYGFGDCLTVMACCFAAEGIVAAILFLLLAVALSRGIFWRLAFAAASVSAGTRAFYQFLLNASIAVFLLPSIQALQIGKAIFALALFGIAVLTDLIRHRRRDAFHWIGVGRYLVEFVVYWTIEIYYRYLYDVAAVETVP